jgi:hypothetical protein
VNRFPAYKQVLVISLTLLATATSCGRKPGYQVARDHFDQTESAYCTNAIDGAERALTAYLQIATQDESNGLRGIDYDMARAITHERLLLIYRKLGDTNKAQIHFERSLESLSRYRSRVGVPAPSTNVTQESFAALIQRGERDQHVKWKAE